MRAAAIALASLTLFACEVDPYCLTCVDSGAGLDSGVAEDGDVGERDAQVDAADSAPVDAGRPDGCTEADVESCNDFDDDCDGFVDEGFDLETNPEHCGECGRFCNFAHAFATCEQGSCAIGDCDVGFLDLDEDPANGCEYSCLPNDTTDAVCNNRDDDCDGSIDEDVDRDNDAMNCGVCGRVCSFAHSDAGCAAGVCVLDRCDAGFHDIDGNPGNGCEYSCTAASPSDEVCNRRDDDCDGVVDEGNPGGGVACGSDVGECAGGTTRCSEGNIVCDGEVRATTELCNGRDDDCDTETDEFNPEGGRVCGTSVGRCEVGSEVCSGGMLVCVGNVAGVPEECNGLDEDCDGMSDEGNPGGGAACGIDEGACTFGAITCVGGALSCAGGVAPAAEACNLADDDCDGSIDELNPDGGALCGSDIGRCQPGISMCDSGGNLVCQGEITGVAETCNGQDDDCDDAIDELNPGGGDACGTDVGECAFGSTVCTLGGFVCVGGTGAAAEVCNTRDDDCDGSTDEEFFLQTDVSNCGDCGNVCDLPNATERCVNGGCQVASCDEGWVDLDANEPGCEYECQVAGAEICNGLDDDCDGDTDEDVLIPTNFCNPNGVCAATEAECGGLAGFVCNYPSTYEETETRCDDADNDCDGRTDEAYPEVENSVACSNGAGECQRFGRFVCDGLDAIMCDAPAAGMEADEECNGVDDDCDGSIDEVVADDAGTPWRDGVDLSAIETVAVDVGGAIVQVMAYEASRPDASAADQGVLETLACSTADVEPWTNVDWDTAQAACCALNEDGMCPSGGGSGWRLCDGAEWQTACRGPADACGWSYSSSCGASEPETCNGAEFDCDPATPGDQDCRYTTGAPEFPMCFTDWGVEGAIYDMSGNVREWTATPRGSNVFEVRGGSYNHIEAGRSCNWSFTVAQRNTAAPNTGFRCCMY